MIAQPTCAERIEEEYKREIEVLLAFDRQEILDPEDYGEVDFFDWFYNYRHIALEVASWQEVEDEDFLTRGTTPPAYFHRAIHLQSSWGGPSDGWIFYTNERGGIISAFYYFQDWFDGAVKEVTKPKHLAACETVAGDIYSWQS